MCSFPCSTADNVLLLFMVLRCFSDYTLFFSNIKGTTDSEAFFHLLISLGLENNVENAFKKAIEQVNKLLKKNTSEETCCTFLQ